MDISQVLKLRKVAMAKSVCAECGDHFGWTPAAMSPRDPCRGRPIAHPLTFDTMAGGSLRPYTPECPRRRS